MAEPEDSESTFKIAVVELLDGIVELLEEWVRADAKKPSYALDDSHYERAARVSALAGLAADLKSRFP
jgi:hypothetical protein